MRKKLETLHIKKCITMLKILWKMIKKSRKRIYCLTMLKTLWKTIRKSPKRRYLILWRMIKHQNKVN